MFLLEGELQKHKRQKRSLDDESSYHDRLKINKAVVLNSLGNAGKIVSL